MVVRSLFLTTSSHPMDNAFMFPLIESCKLNGLAPEKYITFLLRKLKGADQYTDKNALLPCFCTA